MHIFDLKNAYIMLVWIRKYIVISSFLCGVYVVVDIESWFTVSAFDDSNSDTVPTLLSDNLSLLDMHLDIDHLLVLAIYLTFIWGKIAAVKTV